MADLIQLRRDTAANWTSVNPTLAQGEFGYETDTTKFKVGDGSTAWNSLAYNSSANTLAQLGTTLQTAANDTPLDADTFNFYDAVDTILKKVSWTNIKATLKTYFDTLYVALTGDQTIAGVKTFSSFPVTPSSSPTTSYQVANKQYVDSVVVGLWDDRGNFDASVNAYPSSGGSGTAGAILKGDIWTISVAGTLPTAQVVEVGDTVRALTDTPGNTQANWSIQQNNIGYTAENSANKATGFGTSNDTLYPSVKAVKDYVVGVQDLYIPAVAMWPRTTSPCADLSKTEISTSLVNIQSLDFDQTTSEYAQFTISLPRNWNNGTVTAKFYWTAAGGSGTVTWGIQGGAYSNDDALSTVLGTAQTVTDTLITTNDLHISDSTSAITLAGTPADADFLAFQIYRDISDTLSADAKLLGVVITLTTDAAIAS